MRRRSLIRYVTLGSLTASTTAGRPAMLECLSGLNEGRGRHGHIRT
jgi:hypothetical protein